MHSKVFHRNSIDSKCMKSLFHGFIFLLFSLQVASQSEDANLAMKEVFGEEVEVPAQYSFDKKVTMELITVLPNGKTSRLTYNMRYQKDNSCVGMTPVEIEGDSPTSMGTTVVDFNQMKMITFIETNGSKVATVFPIKEDQITKGSSLAQESPEFIPTGNEKDILGYTCKEYKLKSTELKGRVWLAEEIDINLSKSFEALGLQFEMGDQGPEEEPRGFIMEFETTHKKTKRETRMKVKDVDFEDRFNLSTDGYIFTSMPVVEEEHRE